MKKLLDTIDKIIFSIMKAVVFLLFVFIVVLILAQVYTRFLTTNSLTWSEELSRFALVFMVFFAAVLVTRQKGHLLINNLVSILPAPAAKVVLAISAILQIVFFILVIWGAHRFFPTAAMRVSPALSIPMPFLYICVPIFSVLCIFYNIRDLVEIFVNKREEI